jgi:hypothetical protein
MENLSPSSKKFFRLTPDEINELLPRLHEQIPDFESRLHALAKMRLDTPYEFNAIGDGAGNQSKPIFRVDKTNCTAFVLTNIALASAINYQQAESLMIYLNYYPHVANNNPISYKNRIHFTADRLLTSEYFELITTSIAQAGELDTVRIVLNRQEDGAHFLPIDWEKAVELPYIPKKYINRELLERMPAVCGIGVIQKELFKKGIIIAHEGILFDGKDFIHASKFRRKVIQQNFLSYSRKKKLDSSEPVCDGIVIYLMNEVKRKNNSDNPNAAELQVKE